MANYLDSGSEEEFEGFSSGTNQSASKRKKKLVNKALESTESDEEDDSDDFKGSIKSSGKKRKALEAFESDEDESGSEEDDASSNDDEYDDDDDDTDDDNGDDEGENGIETEDTLDVDLNEDDMPSNSDQCPICLMSLGGQKLGTPSECQHVFCLACIMEWSKNANTCPVDRKVFHEILVHSTKKGPILERIGVEDRRVPEVRWEQEPTFCEVCNECDREDRMLLCDGCDKGYHLECLRPRLYTVPAGSWYCTTCIEIRQNEQMAEEGAAVPELLPGNIRRSRGTTRASTTSETSSETSEPDGPQIARTAATSRRRSSSTRGRGRGRGRTASRSSTRGRPRSRTTGRSRTGSTSRRGRGGKKKTRKRTSSTTGKPKRKKRKTTTTKKKRRSTTKSKSKKRKVDNPFEGQAFRGCTPRERLNNSLRASGGASDTGRGLGMTSGLSIFGDHYALDGFEDDSTNEPEQSDSSSSIKSGNSDVLGSIFNGIEALHDQNATVSRDGRVVPSESPDKKSPKMGSQDKIIENSSNQSPGRLSREGSDASSSPRDLKQRESEKPGNKSCDKAKVTARDHNNSHVTAIKTREGQSKERSRDGASVTSLSRDQDKKETTKRNENYQTGLQNMGLGSSKLNEKASASTEQIESATLENRTFKEMSRNNSSATSNFHKTSTEPKQKLASPALRHSSSSTNSKTSIKLPTPSQTNVRFKIPKKSSHLLDSSISRESPTPGTLPSESNSSQDSEVSHSIAIPDSSLSKTSFSSRDDSSTYKRVSPILWNDRDIESKKIPEFKADDSASRAKSSSVCPKARLPKTPPNVPTDSELKSSEHKKISLGSDTKNELTSLSRNFEEKHESGSRLGDVESDLGSGPKDSSDRSAFSPVTKTEEKISDLKKEISKNIPTTEVNSKASVLGKQSPNFNSKPSLQQLPTSLRSSWPLPKMQGSQLSASGLTCSTSISSSGKSDKRRSISPLSKSLGPRPSSSGITGSASSSLSGKTERQSSPGQRARVIRFSGIQGELKIKVVPNQDETQPALRNSPNKTYPTSRSIPEETHPTLRRLPEEFHPTKRSLTQSSSIVGQTHPPLNAVQPLSSLKPLKPVARHLLRPKLKMLSTSDTSQPVSGTLISGDHSSCTLPNRTNQNLAIIQMLRHKTSSLRSEVEKEHELLREELESSRSETPDPDSLSRGSSSPGSTARLPLESSLEQREISTNRPRLSSLLGSPRNLNLPVAVVRPSLSSAACVKQSVSFAGFADSDSDGFQSNESEREKNRKKGIARLQRIERIKNVVKASLQTYYDHNEITKNDFKEIFTRAVDKVKDSNHEVDRHRIAHLVKKYVKMFKGLRVLGTNHSSVL